jgi:hypothetical protein
MTGRSMRTGDDLGRAVCRKLRWRDMYAANSADEEDHQPDHDQTYGAHPGRVSDSACRGG